MFKKILIPISSDGLAKSEVHQLLRIIGPDVKKVTLLFVSDPFPPNIYSKYRDDILISEAKHQKACQLFAHQLFTKVGSKFEGKAYETCHVFNMNVANGILEAAKKTKADLIAMASRKRKGLAGMFFGSDTHWVIVGTKLPVLVV